MLWKKAFDFVSRLTYNSLIKSLRESTRLFPKSVNNDLFTINTDCYFNHSAFFALL